MKKFIAMIYFIPVLCLSNTAYAEYSAEIVFPDGEKKVYILSENQMLPDLKTGWDCAFSVKTSSNSLKLMNLLCSPSGQSGKDVFIVTRCIDMGGGFGELANPVMLGNKKKTTDIVLRCN